MSAIGEKSVNAAIARLQTAEEGYQLATGTFAQNLRAVQEAAEDAQVQSSKNLVQAAEQGGRIALATIGAVAGLSVVATVCMGMAYGGGLSPSSINLCATLGNLTETAAQTVETTVSGCNAAQQEAIKGTIVKRGVAPKLLTTLTKERGDEMVGCTKRMAAMNQEAQTIIDLDRQAKMKN